MKLVAILAAAIVAIGGPAMVAADCKDPGGAITEGECHPVARNKKLFRLHFKPDTPFVELVAWYSMVTCKQLQTCGKVDRPLVTLKFPDPVSIDEMERYIRKLANRVEIGFRETDTVVAIDGP